MNDQSIEQEIQAKGLTATRVTPADIEAGIDGEFYFTAADAGQANGLPTLTNFREKIKALDSFTFCVLVMNNGHVITGESACVSPENFDAELGRKIARQNAVAKIWPLMGYELRSKLEQLVDPRYS